MSLEADQEQCLATFRQLLHSPFAQRLAGPFLSAPPFNPASRPIVLYVGKATAGPWHVNDWFVQCNDRRERRIYLAQQLLREGGIPSAFWRFAWQLAALGGEPIDLGNIIWSNLVRIGVDGGNPESKLIAKEFDVCVSTLNSEIDEYRPDLVVFVTGSYGARIVNEVAPDWPQGWVGDGTFRPKRGAHPPMVWLGHPERKPRAVLQQWVDLIRRVVGERTSALQ